MAEKLFPERSRCKTCGKGLGLRAEDPVYSGLYCTPKCAKMPALARKPDLAPRECVTQRDGEWVWKRRYRSEGEIPDRVLQDGTSSYECQHCHHLHVGRSLVDLKRAANRHLRSRADIADMLQKSRGNATLKQVAQFAGIRPIRIKEWEDPDFDTPSMDALFVLVGVYRMDLVAVLHPTRGSGGTNGAPSKPRSPRSPQSSRQATQPASRR